MNNRSLQIAQSDKRGVIERSEVFIQRKNKNLANAMATEMEVCTFKPKVLTEQRRNSSQSQGIVERLYAYLDLYEKRKETYKHQLNS